MRGGVVGACHRSAQAWPGTFSLYTALDRATGKVIGSLHSRHRALEFKKFLQTLDQEVPRNLAVHLILETSSTHKTSAIQRWPLTHTSCSISPDLELRLNLSRALVSGVDHQAAAPQRASLRASANTDIRAWNATWNEDPRPYVWTKPPRSCGRATAGARAENNPANLTLDAAPAPSAPQPVLQRHEIDTRHQRRSDSQARSSPGSSGRTTANALG